VLELGCGTGNLLRGLAAARPDRAFIGIEPLPNYVEFAGEQARADGLENVRFEVGTGEKLPAHLPPAGLVVSVDVLHHVEDMRRVAVRLREVTAPGATWWAMEPNRIHPYVLAYHVLTPGERTFPVRRFLRQSGAAGWRLQGRRNLFVYPSGVQQVPAWAERLERRTERLQPISGAVALQLRRG
jgi:SAM-dependent methyltransferase